MRIMYHPTTPYNVVALDKPIQDIKHDPSTTLYKANGRSNNHSNSARTGCLARTNTNQDGIPRHLASRRSIVKSELICEVGLWNLSDNCKNTVYSLISNNIVAEKNRGPRSMLRVVRRDKG
nr:BPK_HP1_G0058290.mRNA.1.CDS.1 [Saccharomyces cerevisiae]